MGRPWSCRCRPNRDRASMICWRQSCWSPIPTRSRPTPKARGWAPSPRPRPATPRGSERRARTPSEKRLSQSKEAQVRPPALSLEQVFAAFQAGEAKELKLLVKADVQGSLEPLVASFEELNVGGIGINVLHAATGNIGENDVMLAAASEAVIIGFNGPAGA